MNKKSKLIALALSIVMMLGVGVCFAGCAEEVPPPPTHGSTTPPEAPAPRVLSVSLKRNGETVTGVLSVDISQGSFTVTADVAKENGADGTVTYASSEKTVATITDAGAITLVGVGETVISATAGEKKAQFVLVVNDGLTVSSSYTITVTGGKAYSEKGEEISAAKAGDFVYLKASSPAHQRFVDWNFGEDITWTSGNMFRMPAKAVEISASFEAMLYQLEVIGATVKQAGETANPEGTAGGYSAGKDHTDDNKITRYEFAYDTQLTLEPIETPEGKMFVGWDYGSKNNRMGDLNEGTEYSFAMPDETTAVWAVFSPLTKKILNAGGISGFSSSAIENGGGDAKLEGLSGFRVSLRGNQAKTAGKENHVENIMNDLAYDSVVTGTQVIKGIFHNSSDKTAVTCEVYLTFYGIYCVSGNVTIQPGEYKTVYFDMPLGVCAHAWWGFAITENCTGSADESFNLDFVLGAAPMYPDGDRQLAVTGGITPEYLNFGDNVDQGGVNFEKKVVNQFGSFHVAVYGARYSSAPKYITLEITNMPAYDPENPVTYIYLRAICNVNNTTDAANELNLVVTKTSTDHTGVASGTVSLNNTQEAKVCVVRLAVPRTADDGGKFYLQIQKLKLESADTYYGMSFSLQGTYNNGIGWEEE